MTKFINLTPHPIHVYNPSFTLPAPGGKRTIKDGAEGPVNIFEPSGQCARVKVEEREVGIVGDVDEDADSNPVPGENSVPVYRQIVGQVEGLPESEPGVYLLVSALVRLACPNRDDLLSPTIPVVDDKGRTVGCCGFVRN